MIWIIISLYLLGVIAVADWSIVIDGRPEGIEWIGFTIATVGWPIASPIMAVGSVHRARRRFANRTRKATK